MDFAMKMPDLATTGAPIKIVRWLVEEGQAVARGQVILEVETDKAVMQVESVVSGRLSSVSAREGDEVEAGEPIATFATDQAGAAVRVQETSSPIAAVVSDRTAPVARDRANAPGHRKSFFARNREARMRGGSALARSGPEDRPSTIALTVPQRVAARRIEQSKQSIPHFYLQTSADADAMVARRKAGAGAPISWDAFFVHAAGKALRKFERFTYHFEEDRLLSQGVDAVGLAVDLKGELFTLAIEHPADKEPEEISLEIAEGVARLRSGDPRARMAQKACLTVSNLGGSGIESFAAVINPPESAILAVGKVMPIVTVVEGQIAVQSRVNLTLSVDHRVASGKYAAEFLREIVRELEGL
jgi:pyruvate dehydrogenase E2 component (dihydrolipoamide acetyltransferase)